MFCEIGVLAVVSDWISSHKSDRPVFLAGEKQDCSDLSSVHFERTIKYGVSLSKKPKEMKGIGKPIAKIRDSTTSKFPVVILCL